MNNDKVAFFVGNILNKEFICKNDMDMPTMATDGKVIYYADEWIEKLNDEEIKFSVVHEFLHILFRHPHLVKTLSLNNEVANIAADIVINAILVSDSIGSAPDGVIKPDWNGLNITINNVKFYFEEPENKNFLEIYKEIMDKLPTPPPGNNGYSMQQNGDNKETLDKIIPDKLTPEELEDNEGEANQINASAKTKGSSGALTRAIDELTKGVVPWQNYIRPVIDRATAGYPTYTRPKRRTSPTNVIFPSIKRMGVHVTVSIDTSGSISDKELSYYLGEIDNLLSSYPKGSVTVNALYHTDKVYSVTKSAKYIKDIVSKVESGGTSHLEVFEKAEELKSKVLICLTDGYSDYPDTTTIHNVLFVVTDKGGTVPPFAKRIDVNIGGM